MSSIKTKPVVGMIFPGQGSQSLGMGKELYDRERSVQELFELASSCLETNFVRLCFASSERELRETINAQTSIFLVSAALTDLLREKYEITPDIVAGHSSGEYAALYAAGGMSFVDALYLLKKRALFMDEATKARAGGMIGVLGLPYETLHTICQKYDDSTTDERVAEIVNYNSPGQLVVSGTLPELDAITKDVKAAGGKVLPLKVAGAFHSRLMRTAAKLFAMYMVKVDFKDLALPLINNVQAQLVSSNEQIKQSLINQMSSNVLWWPSMQHLSNCDIIIEVGPSNKLSKMLKREWPDKEIYSLSNAADLEILLERFGIKSEKSELELDLEWEKEARRLELEAEQEALFAPQKEQEDTQVEL